MRVGFDDTDVMEAIERLTREKSMEDFYLPIFLERAEQVYGYTPEEVKELEKEMRVHFAEIQAKEELKDQQEPQEPKNNVKYEAKINAEAAEFYLEQFHQWYLQNAANCGFQYEFIPIEKIKSEG